MKEIEIKILDINTEEIEKKLLELGAEKKSKKLLQIIFFDFENNRISKNNETLRLRKNDKIELTFKGKKEKKEIYKICEETEVTVDNFENTVKILESIGLKKINICEKWRTSFKIGKLIVEIDQHPKIPPYLEIEGNKNEIKELVIKLGFSIEQACNLTGNEVIKKYGINPKNLKF